MIAFKLAYRNLIGAGIRTWLNITVLSMAFVMIIWHKGFLEGWNQQAREDMINWEISGGQYWQENYDPYDPFTLTESHDKIPEAMQVKITDGELTPILISQGTIYPEGRMKSILLKGIDPGQDILEIPSAILKTESEEIPAIIGTRMARNSKLHVGDLATVRWRDANGTFDATEVKIAGIFKTNVPVIDQGQIWLSLNQLQNMLQMPGEASIIVLNKDSQNRSNYPGWVFKGHDILLADMDEIIRQKSVGGIVLYILLLSLALLAIFDTQVLSVFRRQKEIGTHMALGMTQGQVIGLFTIEGAMHAVFAAVLAAIWGIPLLSLQAVYGFAMPEGFDDYGLPIAEKIFPEYSLGLIFGTIIIVLLAATVVSFLPTRKIVKMKPTDAIKGKVQ